MVPTEFKNKIPFDKNGDMEFEVPYSQFENYIWKNNKIVDLTLYFKKFISCRSGHVVLVVDDLNKKYYMTLDCFESLLQNNCLEHNCKFKNTEWEFKKRGLYWRIYNFN